MDFLDLREPVSAWSHGSWLLLSIPATWLLWRRGAGDRGKRISLLVFGLSLALCYAGSMIYHGARGSPVRLDQLDRLDHAGIYLLIAGSYTPMAWNLMQGRWRWGTLALAWLASAVGGLLLATIGVFSHFWSTTFYLVMGWGALICYVELARAMTHRTMFPLLLGGVFYSVGAVLNLIGWPVPWPGVVGPHEVFHLFVMAGSLCHFWFVLKVVAPHGVADGIAVAAIADPADPSATALVETIASADGEAFPNIPAGYGRPALLRASPRPE